jgi:hypothetical protein
MHRRSDPREIFRDVAVTFRIQNRDSGRIEVAREQVPAVTVALHPHRNALPGYGIRGSLARLEKIFAHGIGAGSRERHAIQQASLAVAAMVEETIARHPRVVIARGVGEFA